MQRCQKGNERNRQAPGRLHLLESRLTWGLHRARFVLEAGYEAVGRTLVAGQCQFKMKSAFSPGFYVPGQLLKMWQIGVRHWRAAQAVHRPTLVRSGFGGGGAQRVGGG